MSTLQAPLEGLIAATFTPFHPDGSVDLDAIPSVVQHLVDQGIAGLYSLGSTGEGILMTYEERCQVAEAFVRAAAGRIPVIVQVGSESPVQSRLLAAHAQQIGAAAISAVTPVYFKPDSLAALIATMSHIAAGAPDLPFYYYHIPVMTGLTFSPLEFLKQAVDQIATLRGMKFTAPQVHEFQACVEWAGNEHQIFWGSDEMLMSALVAGGNAAVGSTYNFAAPIYQQLRQSLATGDLASARHYQSQSQALVRTFVRYGARASQKSIMQMIGQDCGPPRLPVLPLDGERYRALESELESLGFFDWIQLARK
jgi:N-acetylneuraminate lyase